MLGARARTGSSTSVRVLARGNRRAVPAILQVPRPGRSGDPQSPERHAGSRPMPTSPSPRRSGNNGVGAYIVDNAVERVYVVVEPHAAPRADRRSTRVAAAELLSARRRRRRRARRLRAPAAAARDAARRRRPRSTTTAVLSVEAGTGTGKSLAYLVPAILWSRANRSASSSRPTPSTCRSSSSTRTCRCSSSAPASTCRTALVKGRGNYLCRRKAAQAEAQGGAAGRGRAAAASSRHVLAWAQADRRRQPRRPAGAAAAGGVGAGRVGERQLPARPLPVLLDLLLLQRAARRRGGRHPRRQPSSADGGSGAARRGRQLHAERRPAAERARDHRRGAPSRGRRHRLLRRPGEPGDDRARARPPAEPAQSRQGRAAGAGAGARIGRRRRRRRPIAARRRRTGSTSACCRGCAQRCPPRPRNASPACSMRCSTCRERAAAAPPSDRADEKLRITEPVRETSLLALRWSSALTRTGHGARRLRARLSDGVLERLERLSEDVGDADPLSRHRARRASPAGSPAMAAALLGFVDEDAAPLHLDRGARQRPRGRRRLSLHRAPIEVGAAAARRAVRAASPPAC